MAQRATPAAADQRHIMISVAYEPATAHGRSLGWIAPELRDAGLTLIDEHSEPGPSRTWAGTVDGPTFQDFADAWHLHKQPSNGGRPDTQAYTFDGANWEPTADPPSCT